jgi:hypothetical protein
MSRASRNFKAELKRENRMTERCCPDFPRIIRNDMTLKTYKKVKRDIGRREKKHG